MIAETVIAESDSENRKRAQDPLADFFIYGRAAVRHPKGVLTTEQLLAALRDHNVKNGEIAQALGIHPSRVTDIFKGDRAVKLDEAARLVEVFELESQPSQRVSPLPASVSRLIVLYLAEELGATADSRRLEELSQDVRAFAEFVADPKVRQSVEAAEAFFQAMRLRRPRLAAATEPQSGRQTT